MRSPAPTGLCTLRPEIAVKQGKYREFRSSFIPIQWLFSPHRIENTKAYPSVRTSSREITGISEARTATRASASRETEKAIRRLNQKPRLGFTRHSDGFRRKCGARGRPFLSVLIYRRSQAEDALWRLRDIGLHAHPPMPPAFRTRVKKLLDLDRAGSVETSAHAFSDAAPTGSGFEAAFSAFDVFCLALGLDLLDVGFKQAEIVFLLRAIRKSLRSAFDKIGRSYPPFARQNHRAVDFPDAPVQPPPNAHLVDSDVYLVLHRIEMTELLPARARPKRGALLGSPALLFGRLALGKNLPDMLAQQSQAVVLELGKAARVLPRLLETAPLVPRGRKT